MDSNSNGETVFSDKILMFEDGSNSWVHVANMAQPRYAHAMTIVYDYEDYCQNCWDAETPTAEETAAAG